MEREILLRFVVCVLVFIIILLVGYLYLVEVKYEKFRLNLHIQEKEAQEAREKLLQKVKDKIELTQLSRARNRNSEDLVAQYIYRQDCVQDLGAEMMEVYAKEYNTLQAQYPSLTELDLLVLSLLGNGMDNYDICTLLKMEKRTLYRRRQLIAQRLGISSTVLDDFAIGFFAPADEPTTA